MRSRDVAESLSQGGKEETEAQTDSHLQVGMDQINGGRVILVTKGWILRIVHQEDDT